MILTLKVEFISLMRRDFSLHINVKKSRLTRKLNSLFNMFNVKTWNPSIYFLSERLSPYDGIYV